MNNDPEQVQWKMPLRLPQRMKFFSVAETVEMQATEQVSTPKTLNHNGRLKAVGWQGPQVEAHQRAVNGANIHQVKQEQTFPPPGLPVQQQKEEWTFPPPSIHERPQKVNPASLNGVWKPGTFGFDVPATGDTLPAEQKLETLPMMVLTGISKAQGQPRPV